MGRLLNQIYIFVKSYLLKFMTMIKSLPLYMRRANKDLPGRDQLTMPSSKVNKNSAMKYYFDCNSIAYDLRISNFHLAQQCTSSWPFFFESSLKFKFFCKDHGHINVTLFNNLQYQSNRIISSNSYTLLSVSRLR